MKKNKGDFHCSILVRTNHSLLEVSQALKLSPTRSNRKGEKLSKLVAPLDTNVWEFEQIFRDYTSVDSVLKVFFSKCPDLCENINKCNFKDDICMRIYLQSDYAQIVNVISPETLSVLSKLGVPVEVSVFSWGKA